ncbi:hypothetical protein [Streptococcus infantarius]|uniref:hypothetical protein n=1 Tax=Streptococcus infantarius TaxID=102684 RepID=UPI0022E6F112|nr:hypothetical protein [Streptococcus infantarius]
MRVKITSKDSPSKPTIIDMSRKSYDFLLENCKTPDYLKEWSEAKTIIETDDILEIEVLEDDEQTRNY